MLNQGLTLHSEGSAWKSKMWWLSVALMSFDGTFPVKGIWFFRALFERKDIASKIKYEELMALSSYRLV